MMSRRRFLRWAALFAAGGVTLPWGRSTLAPVTAPPTPLAPAATTDEPRQYFVPLEDYHELPANCYAQNLITPREIIIHSDGNQHGRDLWLVQITYETLQYVQQSAHFAVDRNHVWQLLPMYSTLAQESYGAKGFNWAAINIEMAGTRFDQPGFYPPENEIRLTARLVSLLMDFYGITFPNIYGHFERDLRGLKEDPGLNFMADFRHYLQVYRAQLAPIKRELLQLP
jgi:hypothetical protein